MKYLLDTHTAIWLFTKSEELPDRVKKILLDKNNTLFVSIISAWEVAIKVCIGKLRFSNGVRGFFSKIAEFDIILLGISAQSIEIVETLPLHHRDPFDRLLIATAKAEKAVIITADENIHKYEIESVW